jgi:hypothetical protein
MISRSNSVKGAKKSLLPRLFLVEFAAHRANVGVTPNTSNEFSCSKVKKNLSGFY